MWASDEQTRSEHATPRAATPGTPAGGLAAVTVACVDVPDSGDRRVVVEEGHGIEFGLGMRAVRGWVPGPVGCSQKSRSLRHR
jgi:hypothetical protein